MVGQECEETAFGLIHGFGAILAPAPFISLFDIPSLTEIVVWKVRESQHN